MNRIQYIIIFTCIAISALIALVIINPGWEVRQRLFTWNLNQGDSIGINDDMNFASLNEGDVIYFMIQVTGDPVDLTIYDDRYVDGQMTEIYRVENLESKYSDGSWQSIWEVPETRLYAFSLHSSGDSVSYIQGYCERVYTQNLFP